MAKMVFDEWYGELTYAQRAAYRKHNVSPFDHNMLVEVFGATAHDAITAAVKKHSTRGSFSVFDMYADNPSPWK